MYKKLLALCLAALLTASAAGCSQGTEGGSAPAEGGSAPAGDAAPSGEVVTIRMGGWGNFEDEHAPGTVGMEEAIGVKIEFQKYPTDADFWNNLPAQIAAKTAPDFISLTNELYLPYINDGLVVPLTSYVEDGTISCWDSIAQNLKDIWEIDGEIYGIPTHQSPAVFAINMNLWNEAGLTEDDFPETWDDVLAICQVFKDQLGLTGLCLNTQEFHFTQYALSFGGGWGLGKTINTPENAAALQFLIDAYHQGYVVTPKELGVSYDGAVLMTNDAAMSTGGSWYINDFAKNAPNVEVRYIKIPHAEGHEDASGTFHAPAYAILKGGAHEKETAMAINYLLNDARYAAIIDLGYIPVDEKFFDEFREKQPALADQIEAIPLSNGFGYPPSGKVFADALISKMEEALFNSDSTVTGAQIVEELQAEYGE